MKKATYSGSYTFRTGMDTSPHISIQTHDSSKLSHVSGVSSCQILFGED